MRLLEISPFLRIILRYSPVQKSVDSYSLDNRIFYFRRAAGHVYINGKKHALRPDTLLLWQRGTAYRFDFEGQTDAVSLNFDFTAENSAENRSLPILLDVKENQAEIQRIKPIFFEDCPQLNSPAVIYGATSIWPYIKELLSEGSSSFLYTETANSARLKLCLAEILRLISTEASEKEDAKVEKVLRYIKTNYREQLTNEKLAHLAGYHPNYLNSIVLSSTGMSLHQHLIGRRLEVAEKMLLSTEASISSIARAVGFSSALVFIRNFKIKNGVPPGRFREKIGIL